MTLLLGCIADDYTGASDLANTLTRNGLRTVQTIGIPDPALPLPEVEAVVVSLKIRSVEASEAVAAALAADAWIRRRGATHVLYKICSTFDSTDAGNIGPVTEALVAAAGGEIAIVTPAFPQTGRTVYRGHLFVNGRPLDESPLKDHPLNPMHDADLVRVLGRQSKNSVGLVDLETIAQGEEAIAARLSTLVTEGKTAAIADAVFQRDLVSLGAVAARFPVSTGASGLGLGLAQTLRPASRSASTADALAPVGGFAAVIAGSCSPATLKQIDVAERSMPVLRLDPHALIGGKAEIDRALAFCDEHKAAGPFLIAASAPPDTVAALQSRYGREASGHAIERATSTIAMALVERGIRRLVVAGGETSGAAVDRLGISALLIGPEIAPGVPLLRTVGDAHSGLIVALKSGNFGGDDFFERALALMR